MVLMILSFFKYDVNGDCDGEGGDIDYDNDDYDVSA